MSEAADMSSWTKEPHRIAVDGNGYVWRAYLDMWSMAPVNPDNSPIPQPVRYYISVDDLVGDFQIAAIAATAKGDYDRAESFQVAAAYLRDWGPESGGRFMTSLADMQGAYLAARGLTLPIVTGREQCQYILGEAAELAVAGKYLDHYTDDWGIVPKHVRCEIADVVLAVVTLANQLGITVEACIAEKTEEDRNRGR